MTFKERYKIASVLENNSMVVINEDGENIIDERVEISADSYAIGEMLEQLSNQLNQLRISTLLR